MLVPTAFKSSGTSRLQLFAMLLSVFLTTASAVYTPPTVNGSMLFDRDTLLESQELLDPADVAWLFGYPGSGDTVTTSGQTGLSERSLNGTHSVEMKPRDVWSPMIADPKGSTVWVRGTSASVKWDTRDPPDQITNPIGRVVLGYLLDGENEHLDLDNPLAEGFDLEKGSVKFKVPYVEPGNEYIVVLFGDSGNRSPTFTIN
ncbi:hypothetical protein K474DRAFT_1667497 [Panus rudis PR-1116 ss-1]|nr:hypothetical protein K474DRAFT_1667497 [Panus rudis PR-1116 ss-1]